jgi:uncharacterized protein (DUF3084 family)
VQTHNEVIEVRGKLGAVLIELEQANQSGEHSNDEKEMLRTNLNKIQEEFTTALADIERLKRELRSKDELII